MRRLRFCAVLAAVLLSACGQGDGTTVARTDSAASELHQAMAATIEANSFKAEMKADGPDGNHVSVVYYQAPDRLRSVGPNDDETIAIGRTTYIPALAEQSPFLPEDFPASSEFPTPPPGASLAPQDPPLLPFEEGKFWRFETPGGSPTPTEGFLLTLGLVSDATDVEKVDSSMFRYTTGTGKESVSGEVEVQQGRVVRMTLRSKEKPYSDYPVTYVFSDFDAVAPIEPPPPDQITEAPQLEPCGPNGPPPGKILCGETGLTG